MSKRQKDTSWELSAGVRDTGLNNLTQALGLRSREIVERLHSDPEFIAAASRALSALHDDVAPTTRPTIEKIKQLMGGRCFLPEEIGAILGLHPREITNIPRLTGRQTEHLEAFLKADCPIMGKRPAAETHILLPQPSTIAGVSFSLDWVVKYSYHSLHMECRFPNQIPDSYYNKVRPSQWYLMFWGPHDESAVPPGTDTRDLVSRGYSRADLAFYALAIGCMKARGADIRPRGFYDDTGCAALQHGVYACRTMDAGINAILNCERGTPALIRQVPL